MLGVIKTFQTDSTTMQYFYGNYINALQFYCNKTEYSTAERARIIDGVDHIDHSGISYATIVLQLVWIDVKSSEATSK